MDGYELLFARRATLRVLGAPPAQQGAGPLATARRKPQALQAPARRRKLGTSTCERHNRYRMIGPILPRASSTVCITPCVVPNFDLVSPRSLPTFLPQTAVVEGVASSTGMDTRRALPAITGCWGCGDGCVCAFGIGGSGPRSRVLSLFIVFFFLCGFSQIFWGLFFLFPPAASTSPSDGLLRRGSLEA